MRRIEMTDGIVQQEEIRHSSNALHKHIHGAEQCFVERGFGKTQNKDYEPLHYENV